MARIWHLPLLIILAIYALAATHPAKAPESHVQASTSASPASPMGMPACTTEDGSGQALCYWDAKAQGNGMGESVVSGDCASVQGTTYMDDCIALHKRERIEVTNADGSTNTVPNGADLVGECIEIDKEMNHTDRIESGFNLGECFKAQLNS